MADSKPILKQNIYNPGYDPQDIDSIEWFNPLYITDDNIIHLRGHLIDDNAVNTNNIAAESIVPPTENIPSKIAPKAIVGDILGSNGNVIKYGHIDDRAIRGRNIESYEIDYYHLAEEAVRGGGTNDGDNIKNYSISGTKLSNGAVDSRILENGAVKGVNTPVENYIIDGSKIAKDAIVTENIVDGAIRGFYNETDVVISGSKIGKNAIIEDNINDEAILPRHFAQALTTVLENEEISEDTKEEWASWLNPETKIQEKITGYLQKTKKLVFNYGNFSETTHLDIVSNVDTNNNE